MTPPSQCTACVPVETYADFITHISHEPGCPNRKTT